MMPWTRTKEERRLLERQEREPRVILLLKEKSRWKNGTPSRCGRGAPRSIRARFVEIRCTNRRSSFKRTVNKKARMGCPSRYVLPLRVYVAVVLLSFALSRRSAFSNAFVFDWDSKTRSPSALSKTDHLFMRIPRSRSFSSRLNKLTVGELRSRVPLRLHLQVVETTVVLPVVSKRVGVYEDGEDTVTGVGRERLRLRKERRGRDGVRWKYRRLHRPRRCI